MSITPRIAIKDKNKTVLLHTRVINDEDYVINGEIITKITGPSINNTIIKKVKIRPKTILDKYYKYKLVNKPFGRYKVDTRLYFGDAYVVSETTKTDFFDYTM